MRERVSDQFSSEEEMLISFEKKEWKRVVERWGIADEMEKLPCLILLVSTEQNSLFQA